jgi:hypothetical protein
VKNARNTSIYAFKNRLGEVLQTDPEQWGTVFQIRILRMDISPAEHMKSRHRQDRSGNKSLIETFKHPRFTPPKVSGPVSAANPNRPDAIPYHSRYILQSYKMQANHTALAAVAVDGHLIRPSPPFRGSPIGVIDPPQPSQTPPPSVPLKKRCVNPVCKPGEFCPDFACAFCMRP